MIHPIPDCEHPFLCLLVPGIASQEAAISGFFQQNLASVWAPNGGARESTQGAKGSATLKEDQQYGLTSNLMNYVSSCICGRGWPSQPSKRGESLVLVKIIYPSTGECQGQEAGVGELASRVREGIGNFQDSI